MCVHRNDKRAFGRGRIANGHLPISRHRNFYQVVIVVVTVFPSPSITPVVCQAFPLSHLSLEGAAGRGVHPSLRLELPLAKASRISPADDQRPIGARLVDHVIQRNRSRMWRVVVLAYGATQISNGVETTTRLDGFVGFVAPTRNT